MKKKIFLKKWSRFPLFPICLFVETITTVADGSFVRSSGSYLYIADGHTEEQVHDDDRDNNDEDGQDDVGCEGEILGQVFLLQVAREVLLRTRRLVEHDLLALGIVKVVVLDLTGHHHHDLKEEEEEEEEDKLIWGRTKMLDTYFLRYRA